MRSLVVGAGQARFKPLAALTDEDYMPTNGGLPAATVAEAQVRAVLGSTTGLTLTP
ncbi:MAG: hypothetical protein U0599_10790 [Vicinamibacteria bacterium]